MNPKCLNSNKILWRMQCCTTTYGKKFLRNCHEKIYIYFEIFNFRCFIWFPLAFSQSLHNRNIMLLNVQCSFTNSQRSMRDFIAFFSNCHWIALSYISCSCIELLRGSALSMKILQIFPHLCRLFSFLPFVGYKLDQISDFRWISFSFSSNRY